MVADVDQLCRIVLAQRRRHGEADADERALLISAELARRHRWRAIEVHCQPDSRIASPNRSTAAGCPGTGLHVPPHDRHRRGDVGGPSCEAEGARERKRRRVDPGVRLVDRRRRIEGQITPVVHVGDCNDVQGDRDGPIRAGLELLRRRERRQQEQDRQWEQDSRRLHFPSGWFYRLSTYIDS